jgi:hypothetical protein
MDSNVLRFCGHGRWPFIYWLDHIHKPDMTPEQIDVLNGVKYNMGGWLISTSGYYDKTIYGNWKGDEINGSVPPDTKLVDREQLLSSPLFNRFLKEAYEIIINRSDTTVLSVFGVSDDIYYYQFNKEIQQFKDHIYPETIPNYVKQKEEFGLKHISPDITFKVCENKRVLIINLFADLLKSHYESGKMTEWYTKLSEYNNCVIPSFASVSSIEIPYTFGNGLNETKNNNFFETLDDIKHQIDLHDDTYDVVLISAGMYTPFIADYIDKCKHKRFICYGRELSNMFCIQYKNTYTWCGCEFTINNIEPYLCQITDKYKLNGYEYIENGCYWT